MVMPISGHIEAFKTNRAAAQRRFDAFSDTIRDILNDAKAAGRADLTATEDRRVSALFADRQRAQDQLTELDGKIDRWSTEAHEDRAIDRLLAQVDPDARNTAERPAYDRVARVGSEQHLYRAPSRGGRHGDDEPSYLQDLYRAQVLHDPSANSRLERHGREIETDGTGGWNKRAIGSGAVSGFVPPQYLSSLFAEFARAGRPLANLCTPMPLPTEGMTLNVPRITTSTATAVQAAEGGAIGNADPDDTLLAVPVVTIGGYVDSSRQAIERGTLVEELLFADLAADYAAKLDGQLINGSGGSGQHLGLLGTSGINAITYTDGTPTIPELWPKLADAVGKVMSLRFTGPTAMVSHPTVWAWLLAERDSTGRPMFEPTSVAFNPLGTTGAMDYAASSQGNVMVPFVADGNVPTNLGVSVTETRIILADFRDTYLFEDNGGSPTQLRFDQVLSSTLQIRLVAYGYSAFAGGRQPKGISVVAGTGLIVPAL